MNGSPEFKTVFGIRLSDICLVIIAVFTVLAFFKGWG